MHPALWFSTRKPFVAWLLWLTLSAAAFAQFDEEDHDLPRTRPGLVVVYQDGAGHKLTRVDERLHFMWRNRSPDPRIAPGPFQATWRGQISVEAPGRHEFRLYIQGRAKLLLNGRELLSAEMQEPTWVTAESVEFEYGPQQIELSFAKTDDEAVLVLAWQGPGFQLEPVPARFLFHDPEKFPDEAFARGERLVRALRCTACHTIAGEVRRPLAAPTLDRLRGNIRPDWLVDWLTEHERAANVQSVGTATEVDEASSNPAHDALRLARRMPSFGFDTQEARAVAAWLMSQPAEIRAPIENTAAEVIAAPKKSKRDSKPIDPRTAGRLLFSSVGCLACHRVGEQGDDSPFGGGDLTRIADKRPEEFFTRWLADPASVNANHRMPLFRLSDDERTNLAAYLKTLHSANSSEAGHEPNATESPSAVDRELGKKLFKTRRCNACHASKNEPSASAILGTLSAESHWEHACSGTSDRAKNRPGYRLTHSDAEAIRIYATEMARADAMDTSFHRNRLDYTEHHCAGCHSRDVSEGLSRHVSALVEAEPELAALAGGMSPPSLTGIGDKLHEEALIEAVKARRNGLRPWLAVRMPQFELSETELQALSSYFVDADRMPEVPRREDDPLAQSAIELAGRRLVTSEGFGCTSCHAIGGVEPIGVALNAHGADLSMVGTRVRRPWFDRWVRNPVRMVPRMEMPGMQRPARGVLNESLDDQLTAVWAALNTPGFTPPQPNPLRIVRATNMPGDEARPTLLTDVIYVGKQRFIKPLVIGFTNRHSVLFDLENARLAAWWIGDTAQQRTRGKTWLWESGNVPFYAPRSNASDFALVRDTKDEKAERIAPERIGQFVTEFDSIEYVPRGVSIAQRLHFKLSPSDDVAVLRIAQTWTGTPVNNQRGALTGFTRRIEAEQIPQGWMVEITALNGESIALHTANRAASIALNDAESLHARLIEPADAIIQKRETAATVRLRPLENGKFAIQLAYDTSLPIDQYQPLAVEAPPGDPVTLHGIPGFEAVQLPISGDLMPTGLAWRDDGTLVVSCLKGRVWLVSDKDHDGLPETLSLFCDGLAAPYGVAVTGDAIDVINKYALLRLHDDDHDGRADRIETLASGWGHTEDYHDWAVGLPRDSEGNYYLGLPAQQDQRSDAAAQWRGTIARLRARQSTPNDPRSFSLELVARGLRFPMGLALNQSGELFVTDNQGNYNPFNELNLIRQGSHYGFINELDQGKPVPEPAGTLAINIPHPWTRSVNGICFLNTPTSTDIEKTETRFGPFEGQLVGCEYDTRRLVRMSLDRVNDVVQGAVYPMSVDPAEMAESLDTLEGPLSCGVARNGDLYIGSIRDSGWGGGTNTGSIVRLLPTGELPLGIAQVKATPSGFRVRFTQPVDPARATDAANISIESFHRVSTPEYGGPDIDRRRVKVTRLALSDDRLELAIDLERLEPGSVYELHLAGIGADGQALWPSLAFYTLNAVPVE